MIFNSNHEFERDLARKSKAFTQNLKSTINKRNFDAPQKIVDAVNYTLFSDSKRIRPILTIEIAKALGEDPKLIIPLAEAIEMIHSYSLIHDDLPAMDDASLRRGKKTNHLEFGEDIAILAGDGLLNMAMERALEGAPYVPYQDAKNYLLAMRVLFNDSGINGMIGGQVADTCDGIDQARFNNLDYIESHKTGALISAAILCGAIPYIGMDDPRIRILFEYSKIIGKLFQIVDDILDSNSTPEQTGKDSGIDERNNTRTYLTEHSMEEAEQEIVRLKRDAYEQLDKLTDGDFEFLYYLTDYLVSRKK